MSEWVRLGDVFNLQMGKTPSRSNLEYWNNGDYDWVSISDMSEFKKYVGKTKETISELGVKESGIKAIPPNTVIMSFKLSIGKTAITISNTFTNEAIMAFIPKEEGKFNVDYLYYLLSGTKWVDGLNRAVMGITLNKKTLSEKKIPCPSLSEQQHIVSVLDTVNSLIDARKKQIALLDEAEKSLFVEMFGDPVDNQHDLPIDKLENYAKAIDPQPSHRTPPAEINGVPYVGITECNYITKLIEFEKARIVSETVLEEHKMRYSIDDGDFIIGKIGTIGKPFHIPSVQNYTLSANTVLIKPNTDKIDPQYLFELFESEYINRQLNANKKTTSVSAFGIQKVRNLDILIPAFSLQKEFAARISSIEERRREMEAGLQQMEEARSALMQEYFG